MCPLLEVQVYYGGQRSISPTYMKVNLIILLASRFSGQLLFSEDMELIVGGERWVTLEEEDGGSLAR